MVGSKSHAEQFLGTTVQILLMIEFLHHFTSKKCGIMAVSLMLGRAGVVSSTEEETVEVFGFRLR